jgi:hypothetical protein
MKSLGGKIKWRKSKRRKVQEERHKKGVIEKKGTGGKVQGTSAREEGYRRKGTRKEC